MNGFERITAALKGDKPDKTPIMLHNFMMAAREAGYTQAQYRQSSRIIAESFMQAVEKYQYDGIVVDIDTVTLAGAAGVPVNFSKTEPASCSLGLLVDIQDFVNLKPVKIENYKYVQVWLEAVHLLKSHYKNEIYVRGNCDQAPFSLASILRTPQKWLMDLYEHEDLTVQLLEYCTDVTLQFIGLMAQTGADMLSNGDSPASPDLISPDLYKKYALPYEKMIVNYAHKCEKRYAIHICGDTSEILEDILETNTDAIELDHKTNILRAHNLYKDRVVFIGNIDPSGVLANGTVAEVKDKTEQLLRIYSDSPRFILNAGCAIPAFTPEENLKAMIAMARTFSG